MNLGIVMKVAEWMFHELSLLLDILRRHPYQVGMFVIGPPLLKKVVDIFRRLSQIDKKAFAYVED